MSEGDWQYQQHPRPKMLAVQYIQVPSIWRRRRLLASGLWHMLFRALGVSRRGNPGVWSRLTLCAFGAKNSGVGAQSALI